MRAVTRIGCGIVRRGGRRGGPSPVCASTAPRQPNINHAPFEELKLSDIYEAVGGVRVRQHANPLRKELQVPAPPPDWAALFDNPSLPLALDVGCGSGRFSLMLGRRELGKMNCLGLDIRARLVDRASEWAATLGARNVGFAMANATVSIDSMLSTYPGPLTLATIQFPDPHFKARHRKRRVVQAAMADALSARLAPGGRLLLQSDVLGAAGHMRDGFETHCGGRLRLSRLHFGGRDGGEAAESAPGAAAPAAHGEGDGGDSRDDGGDEGEEGEGAGEGEAAPSAGPGSLGRNPRGGALLGPEGLGGATAAELAFRRSHLRWWRAGWLPENPVGVPTEREVATLDAGLPVYRVLLEKSECA